MSEITQAQALRLAEALDLQIGIRRGLETNQGIHVEAVDGRMTRSLVIDNRLAPVGPDDRGTQRCRAGIVPESWTAEPDRSRSGRGRRPARAGSNARETHHGQQRDSIPASSSSGCSAPGAGPWAPPGTRRRCSRRPAAAPILGPRFSADASAALARLNRSLNAKRPPAQVSDGTRAGSSLTSAGPGKRREISSSTGTRPRPARPARR